jgi:ribosome recycling factor|tara:strand:+ start:469 stop:1029 length:561 start_codon:yes stop_codon:yes gene_type:complete
MEEINFYLEEAKESMVKAIDHFETEIAKVRAGKASPSMFNGVNVDYYGSATPINQVASVTNQDARTLVISPWEKPMLQEIERAIMGANLGVTPMNDGDFIRIVMPPLTEERRRDLVKQVKEYSENAKISLRNVRRDANDGLKQLQKDGTSEDLIKDAESNVQNITNDYAAKIDTILVAKEKEIMTV